MQNNEFSLFAASGVSEKIKVSELSTATSVKNSDYFMIVQDGVNKKVDGSTFGNFAASKVDLSNYVTTTNLANDYVAKNNINSYLSGFVTTSELADRYTTTEDLNRRLERYATTAELDRYVSIANLSMRVQEGTLQLVHKDRVVAQVKLPSGGNSPSDPSGPSTPPETPSIYYGYIGTGDYTNFTDIGNMKESEILSAVTTGRLKKTTTIAPMTAEVKDGASINENEIVFCLIPKTSNLNCYYVDGVGIDSTFTEDIDIFYSNGQKSTTVNGVEYKVYGVYATTSGAKYTLKIK